MDNDEKKLQAAKHVSVADHMLTQTYPFVQDPKLLLAVVDNLYSAIRLSMETVLEYERKYKRVPPYAGTFNSMVSVLKDNCSRRYSLKDDHFELIQQISEIMEQHKKSAIEFSRKDTFVICSDNYRLKTINLEALRKFISQTKLFVHTLMEGVERDRRSS